MAAPDRRTRKTLAASPGKFALLSLAGAAAAAWVWNRRGETALRLRTEQRLRPLYQGRAT